MQTSVHAAMVATLALASHNAASQPIPGYTPPKASAVYTLAPAEQGAGAAVVAAVQITTSPGWHIYWVNPGDSGLPTRITWKTPDDIKVVRTVFPTPSKFEADGSTSYGYLEGVTALTYMNVSPATSPDPSRLKAHVDLLLCSNACVPAHIDALPSGLSGNEARAVFEDARATMPAFDGFTSKINYDQGHTIITFQRPAGKSFGSPEGAYFYPYKECILNPNSPQQARTSADSLVITTGESTQKNCLISTLDGVLVLSDGSAHNVTYMRPDLPPGRRRLLKAYELVCQLAVYGLLPLLGLILGEVLRRRVQKPLLSKLKASLASNAE